jgi:DNA-binding MarR family transcriptional regulator
LGLGIAWWTAGIARFHVNSKCEVQEIMVAKRSAMLAMNTTRASEAEPIPLARPELPLVGPAPLITQSWYVINRAAQRLRERVEAALLPMGLRRRHYASLAVIGTEGRLSQQELGNRIPIDRATMVMVVDDLERLGLVERRQDPADRRAYHILLTANGERALEQAKLRVAGAEVEGLAPLSAEQRRQLDGLVRILCGWEQPGTSPASGSHASDRSRKPRAVSRHGKGRHQLGVED